MRNARILLICSRVGFDMSASARFGRLSQTITKVNPGTYTRSAIDSCVVDNFRAVSCTC
jgi:hypothetical protein